MTRRPTKKADLRRYYEELRLALERELLDVPGQANRLLADCRALEQRLKTVSDGEELIETARHVCAILTGVPGTHPGSPIGWSREREAIDRTSAVYYAMGKAIERKLKPFWNDPDALERALQGCPHCAAKMFAWDRVKQLRGIALQRAY